MIFWRKNVKKCTLLFTDTDIIQILKTANLKILYLIKKLLAILWKEWNLSIIKYILKKLIKHLYIALMTSDILKMME